MTNTSMNTALNTINENELSYNTTMIIIRFISKIRYRIHSKWLKKINQDYVDYIQDLEKKNNENTLNTRDNYNENNNDIWLTELNMPPLLCRCSNVVKSY